MPSSPSLHVAIIGGGIFGVSTAVHLLRRGAAVTLVTEGQIGSGASGRSLSWINSSRMRSPAYHALRMAGIERYRTLFSRQPEAPWLRFDGGLTWDAEDETNAIGAVFAHEQRIGYETQLLSAEEVVVTTPGVDVRAITRAGAIFNPGEGWVDLPSLIAHLMPEFHRRGGRLVAEAGRASIAAEGGLARAVRLPSGQRIEAEAVLVAAGASTPSIIAPFGIEIPDVTPTALLVKTQPQRHPLRVVLNTPRVAVRPTPDGAFVLDSAWSEDEVVISPDGIHEARASTVQGLLREAKAVLDGNPDLAVASIGIGPKPIPADGDPVFGAVEGLEGCFVAFSHSGATLGLIAGELLASEIATGQAHPLLAPFRAARFNVSSL